MAALELSNCVIDNLMFRVISQIPSVWLGEYQLAGMEYVDDTALFVESRTDMSTALKIYSEEAAWLGVRVNWSKMKLMHVACCRWLTSTFF